jgi:putative flippase GtrA
MVAGASKLEASQPGASKLSPSAAILKLRPLLHEIGKFGVVGAFGAVVDIGVSNVLHHGAGMGPLTSKAISTFLASIVTYLGNRLWAFRHRAGSGAQRDFPIFVALNIVGLAIVEIVTGFTYYVLDLHSALAFNLSANVIGLGLGTLFRFWAYRRWVFRHPDAVAGLSQDEIIDEELQAVIQI